jgi:acrylyl-CoA reductase (NADPH)
MAASLFRAFRVFEQDGRVQGRVVDMSLDELQPGNVIVRAEYSSVNYKDALAGTGAGKVMRRMPLVGGIDVAGRVESSGDPRFARGDAVLITGYELGVSHDGGYAQYVRVPSEWVVRVPESMSLADAMAIGTAGFTAGLAVVEMEQNGATPDAGPVIVTGATGGVGTLAIQCLAARGYQVTALTGKETEFEFLRRLGAAVVMSRNGLQMGTKPLEKATWAGAIDAVGGETLAWLTRTMMRGGAIASVGLTGGAELHTTVMPFILRGVKLLGIDSATCPMPTRVEVWRRLATDLRPQRLADVRQEIGLDDLPHVFATLMKGAARGRYVVRLAN